MTNPTTTPAAATWRRPATYAELRAAVTAFSGWSPLERARRAPELIEAAKAVFADERSAAMGEARAGGLGATALARELGVTRQKVYDALNRIPAVVPDAAAGAAASGHRLLFDGADQVWLVLDAGGQVIADHDGLSDNAEDAAAACSWAAGVLAAEGTGPVDWQPTGPGEYVARPATS